MYPDEIIYRLKKVKMTQAKLAIELSVSPSQINNVIKGRVKSLRIAKYISSLINCKISDISNIYEELPEKRKPLRVRLPKDSRC